MRKEETMKSICIYNHKNPNRHNFIIERFRPSVHHLRSYTPTPASRRRLARLLRRMFRVRMGKYVLFLDDEKARNFIASLGGKVPA
jgi:hypothetical protein